MYAPRLLLKLCLVLAATLPSAVAQTAELTPTHPAPMAATSATVVPMLVLYDGVATSGKAAASMTFLIFKDQTGGEPLWIETQNVATDPAGKYEIYLGSTYSSGLPPDLFGTGEARWLEVQIAGETPGPRTLLTSVPYAMKAADAATLGGLPASAFVLASSIPSVSAVGSGISSNVIPPSSNVTTTGGTNFYLPKFNAATTIINSQIYDNGTSVGIGGVPNPSVKLDVGGAMIMRGNMQVTRTGNASVSKGAPSWGFQFYSNAYNSSTKANDNPYFQLQSEPSGNNTASPSATFNLLFSNNGSAAAETGFYINPDGTIHFASGQTFPGTGNGDITGVTAGTGLTGGGTSGSVNLNIDTTVVPTLSGTNTFAGSNTFTANIYADKDAMIDSTGSNAGSLSPGLRLGGASGEGMSSQRTSGGNNQYGLDLYTDYKARLSITQAGYVSIGALLPGSQLTVEASSTLGAIVAEGGNGEDGNPGGVGITSFAGNSGGSSGDMGGYGGVFYGGDADTTADAGIGLFAAGGFGDNGEYTYSAYFQNDILVNNNVISAASTTKIDHPSDPANKYLVHASVQSSEMMNMYTGNVTTDGAGRATVALPAWFEAENADFRYQLTVLGQQAQAWVAKEVGGGEFQIATSPANVKVSWQITAVRQDAYAKAHPLVVEEAKPAREVGFYRHPELYGQPATKQTEWGRNPKRMQRMEAQRAAAKAHKPQVTPVPSRPVGTSVSALQPPSSPSAK